ncbi:Pentatricopeptide repeat-containing protein [Rhynchospora pubera]|uniref:Pentatricopeptide repeat-containing protein n=1 Tax=Rhynchospora pubera TaxID=906938 RepID=A0AAV8BVN5_9POAL|nr:Pentatricopeptide repeat-containing protein [Rhynchospora pubera]KAJ4800678.1 Pentatricopeptide repeat-containing protein [Rhynchospora pubera]
MRSSTPRPKPESASTRPAPCLLSLLSHHISQGNLSLAISSLPLFSRSGLRPPFYLLSSLLHRCLSTSSLHLARQLYFFLRVSRLYKSSVPCSAPLATHLLRFHFLNGDLSQADKLFAKMPNPTLYSYNVMLSGYARLGVMHCARGLFDRMPYRDLVSWNTMIFALARNGSPYGAVDLYFRLRRSSYGYNQYTFTGVLYACCQILDTWLVKQIHKQLLIIGLCWTNLVISSSLVDAYARCGLMHDAREVFDEMRVKDLVAWTAMVHGYAKCGDLESAQRLFDAMPERNSITWNALIGGYIRVGQPMKALDLFRRMVHMGFRLDHFNFSSSLNACATARFINFGKQIHCHLIRTNFKLNAVVFSSLIDMYSKCGNLAGARYVFSRVSLDKRDIVVWSTMMSALSQHGLGRETLNLFNEMIRSRKRPNPSTLLIVLNACNSSGLVHEGVRIFAEMEEKYGFAPREKHFSCLIDLLAQVGLVAEAIDLIGKMPSGSSERGWHSLFASCKISGCVKIPKEIEEVITRTELEFQEYAL